jgi:hypothetical protein
VSVDDCTGNWISYRSVLVSEGGRDRPASWAEANRLLVGEIGTSVMLRYRAADGVHEVSLTRTDVYAPDSSFSDLVLTAHFAVHHQPADAHRARSVAAKAERAYSSSGLPRATDGRRAHLWVVRDHQTRKLGQPYPYGWGAWATGRYDPDLEYGELLTYLAYGIPGAAGGRLSGAGWVDANTLHRAAVSELLGHAAWLNRRSLGGYSAPGASLREYIRQRYGVARLRQIWSSSASFDDAVAQALGVSRARLEAEWRRHIFSLGPDPAQWPSAPAMLGAFTWGALLLLAGALVARRREVD